MKNLGLVCISEMLKESDNLSFRTMTRKTFNSLNRKDAEKRLKEIILHNFDVSAKVIRHCYSKGIMHYRMSSSIMPLVTDSTLFSDNSFQLECYENFEQSKFYKTIQEFKDKMTFSTHPGQFVVLGSLTDETVVNSIRELEYHGLLHDMLGLPQNHSNPINIHVGSSPKDEGPVNFVNRFIDNYFKCSDSVKNRLTLENEDKGFFNTENLYKYFGDNFTLCFDNLHHDTNSTVDAELYFEKYKKTWKDYIPVFHLSQQLKDERRGAHADYITSMPDYYKNFHGILEVEVKQKDFAILKLMNLIKENKI